MSERADYVVALLLEEGLVTEQQHALCATYAAEQGVDVTDALVSQNIVTRRQLAITLAEISECPFADLDAYEINIQNAHLMPQAAAQRLRAFPLFVLDGSVAVGMVDPLDLAAVDQLRRLLKSEVEPVLCERHALTELIGRAYSLAGGSLEDGADAGVQSLVTGDEPMVAAVNQILTQAIREGASDIHIGPDEHELHLRYRIDGALQKRHGPPKSGHSGLVQRLKVMASLDLTQTRRPQDGKFRFELGGKAVDVRMSIIPTIYGENVVLRLLTSGANIAGFSELGIGSDTADAIGAMLDRPHGMFLVTGPTGSGKTTTLYTAIKRLNTPDRNVMTIEDPVEIRLPLVRQLQVNSEIGMTFAGALRSILRQDPDVVLVGEIRDEETARIACQAALTGHLVLSTLHTNDAPGAVGRLRDMGCPPFAINAALVGAMAQRLVRRNCDHCAAPESPDEILLRRFGVAEGTEGFRRGTGCAKCMSRGYRGRLAVVELFEMQRELQELVESGAASAVFRETAVRHGMRPMWRDGLQKALMGFTTLEEIARATAVSTDELAPPTGVLECAA